MSLNATSYQLDAPVEDPLQDAIIVDAEHEPL
jgi:hypothetical protein